MNIDRSPSSLAKILDVEGQAENMAPAAVRFRIPQNVGLHTEYDLSNHCSRMVASVIQLSSEGRL